MLLITPLATYAQAENMDTILDVHHILAYLVAALLISIFVMIFYNRVIYYREQEAIAKSRQLNGQVALIMRSTKTEAWTYDLESGLITALKNQDNSELVYTPIEFAQFYDRDDFIAVRKVITAIRNRDEIAGHLFIKSAPKKDSNEEQRIYDVSISILRRDKHGQPAVILGTAHDVTETQRRAEHTRNMMQRFQTVFESSLVDMMYFDAEGYMIDINEKALESYHVKDKAKMLASRPRLSDFPTLRGIDLTIDEIYASSLLDLSKIDHPIGDTEEDVWGGNKSYYERIITPLRDQQGNLSGIVMAGRNITEMVNSQHHQREASTTLERKTKDIENYIESINYSLKVSNVRLMKYYPATHELEISSEMRRAQYRLTSLKAVSLIAQHERRKAKGLMIRMDHRHKGIISETFETIFRDDQGRSIFLNFNIMPIFDKEGNITHYFGMCRNETEITYTERQLQKETMKALETEQLKDTFLLNMSYELRTPLNAVIGFAELFGSEHNEEDEPIFAEEIKKNTHTLLTLINDILFLSRLDAKMIEYNYQTSDFAMLFEGWCYMGWSNMGTNVKVVVDNPYSSLMVNIDQQNLGMVIQKLCVFTGQATKEGMVRAKYEYRHGELMITIEDTSNGMDTDKLKKAFDRFAKEENGQLEGTGLDLPIVKELVEQMHGSIELQSELGKGNAFFLNIPCEMVSFDKKAGIIV
ncbi:MAG: HAMP domain-containing histidine kinase [Prevotella sp.]|nr:HAMP domain-containing histidine kinase [Prevotella sp.]